MSTSSDNDPVPSEGETQVKTFWSASSAGSEEETQLSSSSDYDPVFSDEDIQCSFTRQYQSTSSTGSQEDTELVFEDGTLAEGTLAGLSLEERSEISKPNFTHVKGADEFMIYPGVMQKRLKEDYPEILRRLQDFVKDKNYFVYCAPCLLQSLDLKGKRTIPVNIICDVCIFSENDETLVLTFRNMTHKKDRLCSYNAELGRFVANAVRKHQVTPFSTVFGVIDKESCRTHTTFAGRLKDLQEAARNVAIPSSVKMDNTIYREALTCFVRMLPQQKQNPLGPDIGRNIFVERNGYEECKRRLKSHRSVIIVAPAGEGKTMLGYSLLRYFRDTVQEDGYKYEPVILHQPDQWQQLVDKDSHQIILLDDIFGMYILSEERFKKWGAFMTQMLQSLVSGLKMLVMTLRYNIFHDLPSGQILFQPECRIDLWLQYPLSLQERQLLLKRHAELHKIQIKDVEIAELAAPEPLAGFPQQCRSLTHLCKSTGKDLKDLFNNPSPDMELELHNLKTYELKKFALLVILVLNDGHIRGNAEPKFFQKVLDSLGCSHNGGYNLLTHESGSLFGIYLKRDSFGNITFYHTSVKDAVARSLAEYNPGIIIQHGSINLITEVFILGSDEEDLSKNRLTGRDQWENLAGRFVSFIQQGEVADVCVHQAFSQNEFIEIFVKQKKLRKVLQCKDSKHDMPLLYWSACNKNPLFCEKILSLMKENDQTVVQRMLSIFRRTKRLQKSEIEMLENTAMAALLSGNANTLKYVFSVLPDDSQQRVIKMELACRTFPTSNPHVRYSNISRYQTVSELVLQMGDSGQILKHLCENVKDIEDLKLDKEIENAIHSRTLTKLHTILKVVTELGLKEVLKCRMVGPDQKLHTYLCMAVQTGELEIVKEFISADDEMIIDDCCKSLLSICLEKEYIHIAEFLFEGDPNTYTSPPSLDIISKCCEEGNVKAVRFLLQNAKYDVDSRNKSGLTLLQIATNSNNCEMLKVLLQHNPNVLGKDTSGNTILHQAVIQEAYDVVSILISSTENAISLINERNRQENTALVLAIERQHKDIVKILLETDADVNMSNSAQETALHVACKTTNPGLISLLLHWHAYVNVTNKDGRSPLHYACEHANAEVIKQLLEKDADVNMTDHQGNTPLHIACKFKGKEVLLINGAVGKQNKKGNSPLHMAYESNKAEAITLLLGNKAQIDAMNIHNQFPLHLACKHSQQGFSVEKLVNESLVNTKDSYGNAPLHLAIESQNCAAVKTLLKMGADVNLKNNLHHTSLCIAMKKQNIELLTVLLESYKTNKIEFVLCSKAVAEEHCGKKYLSCVTQDDPNEIMEYFKTLTDLQEPLIHHLCRKHDTKHMKILLLQGMPADSKGKTGNSCLHLACKLHEHDVIKLLISNGANPGLRNHLNNTAIHTAAEANCFKAIQLMMSDNLRSFFNSQNTLKDTALHVASRHQNLEIMEFLISQGADINIKNSNGEAVLHTACKSPDAKIVELLLSSGADVNQMSNADPPLHIACTQTNLAVVQLLVKHKAHINMSVSGTSPLHVAEMYGRKGIAHYLLDNGANRLAVDRRNRTPIAYRFFTRSDGLCHITPEVEEMLNKNTDVNETLTTGNTALIQEVIANHLRVVKELVRRGADINIPDAKGKTPKTIASELGHKDIAKFLAEI